MEAVAAALLSNAVLGRKSLGLVTHVARGNKKDCRQAR